jgi:hypothetical protein
MNTWNIVAEATFLRRQLSLLRPNLVIQIVVRNDLEDNAGTRGFGEMSNSNPLHPERGDGIFQTRHPSAAFGTRQQNWIANGLDWESRSRFEEAGAFIADLARDVSAQGGRYLLVDYYTGLLPASRRFLASRLEAGQVVFLPTDLIQDERFRVAADDAHWNRAGHELVAKVLWATIRERGLLPQLGLSEWPEAAREAADWLGRGQEEAGRNPDPDKLPGRRTIASAIDFERLDDDTAAQVHGGIFGGNFVAPYAAVILRGEGRRRLRLRGVHLDRRELEGARIDVFVEEAKVGTLEARGGASIDSSFDVPEDIAARTFVSVRFQSDDWVYGGPDLRLHLAFQIRSVALE